MSGRVLPFFGGPNIEHSGGPNIEHSGGPNIEHSGQAVSST
jgi:hypothetical protein